MDCLSDRSVENPDNRLYKLTEATLDKHYFGPAGQHRIHVSVRSLLMVCKCWDFASDQKSPSQDDALVPVFAPYPKRFS